jgi:hypothetical protein
MTKIPLFILYQSAPDRLVRTKLAPDRTKPTLLCRLGTASTPKTTCEYVQDGVYVAKGEYSEYAEDEVYVAKGEYSKNAEEDASVEEGHNEPLAKEGDDEPLAKCGDWLGTTMSPLPQGQLAAYVMQDDVKPLATRASDRVCRARRR